MVQQLLRTPAFHRAVEKVARGVHRIRHGIPPDEMGGTKIDQPGQSGFIGHFLNEVKTQLGQTERKSSAGVNIDRRVMDSHHSAKSGSSQSLKTAEEENADAAWQNAQRNAAEAPKQGFLDEYMSALRQQVQREKKP